MELYKAKSTGVDLESRLIGADPYLGYCYSYPHKTAYRRLEEPIALETAWSQEKTDALFLYMHVPFCSMRCGYCNLLSLAGADDAFREAYVRAMLNQIDVTMQALGPGAGFSRFAMGGGTPSLLACSELVRIFETLQRVMKVNLKAIPGSVEVSPGTSDEDHLRLFREAGIDRISIGVQTFNDQEAKSLGRPQQSRQVMDVLNRIRTLGFPILNIDLIYGCDGQTIDSWLNNIRTALELNPEELYLYPLYVRQQTGLGRHSTKQCDDTRLRAYRAGRDFLLDAGYEQISMRFFRKHKNHYQEGPVYCCQEDGMIGLGAGARSYTRTLHYATEYAVDRSAIRSILQRYMDQSSEAMAWINHGIILNREEQQRRYVIKSLFQVEGLSRSDYRAHFGTDAMTDLPQLAELAETAFADCTTERLQLTALGLERSDCIGPWLYSTAVRERMETYLWT